MSSESNLTIWVAATLGNADAIATLENHWFSGSVQIPAAVIANITGATGQMAILYGEIVTKIKALNIPGLTTDASLTNQNLAA